MFGPQLNHKTLIELRIRRLNKKECGEKAKRKRDFKGREKGGMAGKPLGRGAEVGRRRADLNPNPNWQVGSDSVLKVAWRSPFYIKVCQGQNHANSLSRCLCCRTKRPEHEDITKRAPVASLLIPGRSPTLGVKRLKNQFCRTSSLAS